MDVGFANLDASGWGVIIAVVSFFGTILYQEQKRREDLLRSKLDELMGHLLAIEKDMAMDFRNQRKLNFLTAAGRTPLENNLLDNLANDHVEYVSNIHRACGHVQAIRLLIASYFPMLEDRVADILEPIVELREKLEKVEAAVRWSRFARQGVSRFYLIG